MNSPMNPKVDEYLKKAKKWQEEVRTLRALLLDCHLTEELKWGKPCYSISKGNVVIIIPLKDHCALMFCKGALLKDPQQILGKPGEHTQAGRWIKFSHVREIDALKNVLDAYIREAIEVEKAGLEVAYKQTSDFKVPAEWQSKLDESPALQTAFAALTPGRQRAYLLHFAAPKQSKTRASRVEKCTQQILAGKGLNDEFARRPSRKDGPKSHVVGQR